MLWVVKKHGKTAIKLQSSVQIINQNSALVNTPTLNRSRLEALMSRLLRFIFAVIRTANTSGTKMHDFCQCLYLLFVIFKI